jgi:hypothetical protein
MVMMVIRPCSADRYSKISTMGPGQALMWGISAKPINTIQYGLATPVRAKTQK